MFTKVLVANRGEIAIRVFRALKELDVASVAVYSDADKDALFVQHADEAYGLGEGASDVTYLSIDKIIEIAKRSGAEAIHPGYGFLAENADFAQRCQDEAIVWIGPPASAIDAMGSKTNARELMAAAGVPIVPGTTEPVADVAAARAIIDADIGYPVAIKAASGGGGKGFRVALTEDELDEAFEGAAREGQKFFNDDTVYLERYLPNPRHVEVQILADNEGNAIHLGERDCSVQRRHQKLIEEAPAPAVDAELRARIGEIGVNAAKAVNYRGAGTIEGMLQDGEYYFLEMNTRVQVEHCVTEEVTGIDIVKEGIRVASGEPLSIGQEDLEIRGHAIECRINFEDAAKNFAPAPGKIANEVGAYVEPSGPGVRVDSGVTAGSEISPLYDPMAAKLIVWAENREEATKRMIRALGEYKIAATTLIPFHIGLLESEQWNNCETCHDLTEDKTWLKQFAQPKPPKPSDDEPETVTKTYKVEVSGKRFDVKVEGEAAGFGGGAAPAKKAPAKRGERSASSNGASSEALTSPLQGTVFKVTTEVGAEVSEGDVLFIIEAMKMENEITAHRDGKVEEILAAEAASVSAGDTLAIIK